MRPQEQTKAEAALSGDAESQDTQEVMRQCHQQFGVGFMSSSPSQPIPPHEVDAEMQRSNPRPPRVQQKWVGKRASTHPPTLSSKQGAAASNRRAKTDAKAMVNAASRGQSPKEGPALAGSCKGANGKGRGADVGSCSAAGQRPGVIGTESDASNSRASSPTRSASPAHPPKQVIPSEAVAAFEPVPGSHSGDGGHVQSHHDPSSTPLTSQAGSPPGTASPAQPTAVFNNDAGGVAPPSPKQPRHRWRRMDPSQSPTQSNDGRYEQYLPRGDDLIPTDPVERPEVDSQETSLSTCDRDRTLQEDDTGAVNFRNLDEYNDIFSALGSLATGRPSHGSPHQQLTGNPETPAPLKNPFAGSKAHLLPASQMFGQTQVSSAYRAASPTSSRPSPDNFPPHDPIPLNLFASSPLKNLGPGLQQLPGAVSSPQLPAAFDTSPQHPIDGPVNLTSAAVRSTPSHPARTFPRGLREEHEPLYTSRHEYDSSSHEALETESDGNESEDDVIRRHYQALAKRAKAEKTLASIKYERQSLEDVVVPSTSARQGGVQKTDSQKYLDQCEGRADDYSQITVEDSQDCVVIPSAGELDSENAVIDDSQQVVITRSAEDAAYVPSNDAVVMATLPNTARSASRSPVQIAEASPGPPPTSPARNKEAEELGADPVPKTSPAMPQPRAFGKTEPLSSIKVSKDKPLAALLRGSLRETPSSQGHQPPDSTPTGVRTRSPPEIRQPATHGVGTEPEASKATRKAAAGKSTSGGSLSKEMVEIAESSPVGETRPPVPGLNTRASLSSSRNQGHNTSPPGPGSPGSSLSVLTTTPNISSETTPLTEGSPDVGGNAALLQNAGAHTSPSAAKAGRSRSKVAAVQPKPRPAAPASGVPRNLRTSARRSAASFGRDTSVSTDELARSPPSSAPAAFEQSAILSRIGRSSLRQSPVSREPSRGGGGSLFAGMVFAVSFQAKQPGEKDSAYNSRLGLSNKVGEQIRQGGGKILPNGFEQLFEIGAIKTVQVASSTPPPDEEIKLTAAARATGFTALIADGHSRKVKYMQALALGLPCIHSRWITTCTEKQKLVDWSHYLLCAGNSSYLGEAIRSRNIPIYDAASAKLSRVINNRPQLLRGSRILIVLRKQDESKKMAYIFLARVLGASLSRVYTVDEARRQLKSSEDAGYPYDWVFVEEKMAGRTSLFADDASSISTASASSRKRKRKSTANAANPAPKKTRTLSNELVIQSLILGRLIEEDEDI